MNVARAISVQLKDKIPKIVFSLSLGLYDTTAMHRKKQRTAQIKEGMLNGFIVFPGVLIRDSVATLTHYHKAQFQGKKLKPPCHYPASDLPP
jgi:hypothetical protein